MRAILPLLILSLLLWSCQPDKPQPNPSSDPLQLLTGGSARTWRLQTLAIAGTTQPLPPCRSDDRWTFRSDQSLSFQNPTTCLPNEPSPSATGTFRFTNNNRFLTLSLGSTTETREIIQLSENLLVWTYINDEGKTTEETWIP
jgi:hypothetical protein